MRPTEESNEAHKGRSSTPCTPRSERSAVTCHGCGKAGHVSAGKKWAMCHSCREVCHLQAVCRSKFYQDLPPQAASQQHSVCQVTVGKEGYHLFIQVHKQSHGRLSWKSTACHWKLRSTWGPHCHLWPKRPDLSVPLVPEEAGIVPAEMRTFSGEPLEMMGSLPVVPRGSSFTCHSIKECHPC